MTTTVAPSARPRPARRARLRWDPVRERHVLLAPEGVLVLNATGAAIVGRCDGEHSVAAIAEELSGTYGRDVAEDVRGFVARLAARRWLELEAHGA